MEFKKFIDENLSENKYDYIRTIVSANNQKSCFILNEFKKLNITKTVRSFITKLLTYQKNGCKIVILNDRSFFKYSLFLRTNTSFNELNEAEMFLVKNKIIFLSIIPTTIEQWNMACDDMFGGINTDTDNCGYYRRWSEKILDNFKSIPKKHPNTILSCSIREILNEKRTTV